VVWGYWYICVSATWMFAVDSMFYGIFHFMLSICFYWNVERKTPKCGSDYWCDYIFLIGLNWGVHIVKTVLQVSGGWTRQSELVRTPSAGRQPGHYWREHDDPVNNKSGITQMNLNVQTLRDVIKRLSNLLNNQLPWETLGFTNSSDVEWLLWSCDTKYRFTINTYIFCSNHESSSLGRVLFVFPNPQLYCGVLVALLARHPVLYA